MAVSYISTVAISASETSPFASVTIPAGSNRAVLFFYMAESPRASPPVLSSVTYDAAGVNSSLTKIQNEVYLGTTIAITVEVWLLKEAQITTGAKDFTWAIASGAPSVGSGRVIILTLGGVNQTTPVYQLGDIPFNAVTSLSDTITTLSGGMAVAAILKSASGLRDDWTANSWTELVDQNIGGLAGISLAYKIADGALPVNVTFSGSSSGQCSLLAINAVGIGVPILDVIDIDSLFHLGTGVATGIDFGSSTGTVLMNTIAQEINSWSDTSINFDVARNDIPYGIVDITITRADGLSSDLISTTLGPQTGWDNVILGAVLADAEDRIEAVPDIASGDFITWGNVTGSGSIVTGINGVLIHDDGSFIIDEWVTGFDVVIYDGVYSTAVLQTLLEDVQNIVFVTNSRDSVSKLDFGTGGTLNILGKTTTGSYVAVDDEEVVGAYVKTASWGCPNNAAIILKRGGTTVAVFTGSGKIDYSSLGLTLSANNDQNITVAFSGTANAHLKMDIGKIVV